MSFWTHPTHSFFLHRFLFRWIYAQITPPTSVRRPDRSRSPLHAPGTEKAPHHSNPIAWCRGFVQTAVSKARRSGCRLLQGLFHRRASDTALTFHRHNPESLSEPESAHMFRVDVVRSSLRPLTRSARWAALLCAAATNLRYQVGSTPSLLTCSRFGGSGGSGGLLLRRNPP